LSGIDLTGFFRVLGGGVCPVFEPFKKRAQEFIAAGFAAQFHSQAYGRGFQRQVCKECFGLADVDSDADDGDGPAAEGAGFEEDAGDFFAVEENIIGPFDDCMQAIASNTASTTASGAASDKRDGLASATKIEHRMLCPGRLCHVRPRRAATGSLMLGNNTQTMRI
jgi:hypothetical protein